MTTNRTEWMREYMRRYRALNPPAEQRARKKRGEYHLRYKEDRSPFLSSRQLRRVMGLC